MSQTGRTEELIRRLAADLQPVKRLSPPLLRAAAWLGLVVLAAAVLFCFYGLDELAGRLAEGTAMQLAMAGSIVTATLAAIAAFQLSLPDRSSLWALLPLPGVGLWLGSSGLGCFRLWLVPHLAAPSVAAESQCFLFIIALSLPLSTIMLLMLRRARPLRPELVAGTGGLAAAAAAAAALLWFFHPFDASVTDIAGHVVVVLGVIGLNRAVGGRLLDSAGRIGIGGRAT